MELYRRIKLYCKRHALAIYFKRKTGGQFLSDACTSQPSKPCAHPKIRTRKASLACFSFSPTIANTGRLSLRFNLPRYSLDSPSTDDGEPQTHSHRSALHTPVALVHAFAFQQPVRLTAKHRH